MTSKNYYDILGVSKTASESEIKAAFRKLSLENHPDKQVGKPESEKKKAEARFKEIAEAYSILGNAEKRKEYDTYGTAFGRSSSGGPGGVDPSSFFRGFSPFSDLFNFGNRAGFGHGGGNSNPSGGPSNPAPINGRDVAVNLELSVIEQIKGATKSFSIKVPAQCPDCLGKCGEGWEQCIDCGGSGKVIMASRIPGGMSQTISSCPTCSGTGRTLKNPCSRCNGKGRVIKNQEVVVEVPVGVINGSTIRSFEGLGEGGLFGGKNGNIIVNALIEENGIFKVAVGKTMLATPFDLDTTVYVSPLVLAVGGKAMIPTPDGYVTEILKPGLEDGSVLTIPNVGLAIGNTGKRGKVFAHIKLGKLTDIPESIKKELESVSGKLNPDMLEEFQHQKKKFDAIYGKH